jgi:ABC-2 type transport system permease protein
MKSFRSLWLVSKFEFRRHFSIKAELIGLAVILLVVGLKVGGQWMMEQANRSHPVVVAFVGAPGIASPASDAGIRFVPVASPAGGDFRALLQGGAYDGVVVRRSDREFIAYVRANPQWLDSVRAQLADWTMAHQLADRGLTTAEIAGVRAAPTLEVKYDDARAGANAEADKGFGLMLIMLSLLACVGSFGVLFQSISGEKANRVSDVILSCVPAQTWIDGKVAAVTAVALKSMVLYAIYIVIGGAVLMGGDAAASISFSASKLAWIMLFSGAGLVFWNSFFAALAATSDGNYGSASRLLFMIPGVFYLICLAGIGNPENWFMRTLSYLPCSSAVAMPLRIINGEVSTASVLLSFVTLLLGVYLMRRFAGALFRVGMLMYGKSPSPLELLRQGAALRAAAQR